MNSNNNNRADLNPRIINTGGVRPRPQNTRFVYVPSAPNSINNAQVVQTPQASNQNSITNKLCKFFKNLLELEREQGRYKESVAVIQKYINKEINIDELGVQLKGNASKATLPDSLMASLNSNIDDLRREMFYGRVRIDGINPPPESILDLNHQTTIINTNSNNNNMNINISNNNNNNNSNIINPNGGTVNVRFPTTQLISQRPAVFPQANNIIARPVQQPQSQIIRPTNIQAIQPNARQLRPANPNPQAVFSSQSVLNITNANLRSIAPSSPIRPPFIQNQTISTNQIRTVAVSTSALANTNKSVPVNNTNTNIEELKIEGVTSIAVESPLKQQQESTINNVSLPTNILNHINYRNKLNEIIKTESGTLLSISDEALNYVSEAMENFSITLLEQAAVFACHRQEMFKDDPMYKQIDDVRSEMKRRQELDDYQRSLEDDKIKAELFKQAKSRSKMDSQEQLKIKEEVRKIQERDKDSDEYARANMTALKAIGNKRKINDPADHDPNSIAPGGIKTARLVNPNNLNSGFQNQVPNSQIYINPSFVAGKTQRPPTVSRFRNKRIILKDFQLVLDQDIKLKRFKTYKKIFTFGRY